MNAVFITIGKRDLKVFDKNINDLEKDQELAKSLFPDLKEELSLRNWSEFILHNLEKFKDNITFPIITPFLAHLKLKEDKIDKLILVATNQMENSYQKSDTYFVAKIIKRIFLKDNFLKAVEIMQLKQNVSDMDSVYENIKKLLMHTKFFKEITADANIYLLPLGGIPAINFTLILNLILKFKNRLQQYRVDEKTAHVIPINFNEKFLLEMEKFTIENLLTQFFFASIKETSSNPFIKLISEYAYLRLNFNFSEAFLIIEKIMKQTDFRNKVINVYNDHIALMKNWEMQLAEIFFSAVIKIKQKQYVDALLRLYNLTDNLLLEKVCKYYHLDFDPKISFEKWWKKAIKKIKREIPDIEKSLEKINGDIPDLKRSGIPLYNVLIKFQDKNDSVFEISEPLKAVSDLRNKSIAAHGFDGVSLEKINLKLKMFNLDLENLIKKIEIYLNISFNDSVYMKIKDMILRNLST